MGKLLVQVVTINSGEAWYDEKLVTSGKASDLWGKLVTSGEASD